MQYFIDTRADSLRCGSQVTMVLVKIESLQKNGSKYNLPYYATSTLAPKIQNAEVHCNYDVNGYGIWDVKVHFSNLSIGLYHC